MNGFLFTFLAGAATATIAAVFALAAVGKLFACRQGARSLCAKAALDAAMAAVVLLPWQGAQLLGGALALCVGVGGWAVERLGQAGICRCFGLMNRALHRFRNLFRVGLASAGAILLAAADAPVSAADPHRWQGAALALALVLLALAHALGKFIAESHPAKAGGQGLSGALDGAALAPDQPVGVWPDGRPATLGELRRGDAPLAILFSLRGCAECDTVKAELRPYLAALPFPLHVLEKGAADPATPGLSCTDGALGRRLGIASYPALAVIDARTWRPIALALGNDAIRRRLLQLLMAAQAAPIPPAVGVSGDTKSNVSLLTHG